MWYRDLAPTCARYWCLLLALLCVGLTGCPPNTNAVKAPQSGATDRWATAMGHKTRGLAQLENLKFGEAEAELQLLATLMPKEPLAWRNLAICRLLALRQTDRVTQDRDFAMLTERVSKTIETLVTVDDSVDTLRIAARAAQATDQPALAADYLAKALAKRPNDATLLRQKLELLKATQPGGQASAEQLALQSQIVAAAPDNLFAMQELLSAQLFAKDPGAVDTLEKLQQGLVPMQESIQANYRMNAQETLSKAAAAVREGNWSAAMVANRVCNVIKPDPAVQSDLRRLTPSDFDFVLLEFQSEKGPARVPPAPESIRFETWSPGLVPPTEGVRDTAVADFNLDLKWDLAVLLADRVQILTAGADGAWSVLCETPLTGDYQQLLVADLDDDVVLPPTAAGSLPGADEPRTRWKDADPDVVVYGTTGVQMLENTDINGARGLAPQTGNEAWTEVGAVQTAALCDLEQDGDLDLVLGTAKGIQFWRQRSRWLYDDASSRMGIAEQAVNATAIGVCDWDQDIDLDLIVGGPQPGWLENVRYGRFRWHAFDPEFPELVAATSIAVFDADGNGWWDLATAGPTGLGQRWNYASSKAGGVAWPTEAGARNRVLACDLDHNAEWDLLTCGAGRPTAAFAGTPEGLVAASVGDLDGDGDLDIAGTTANGKLSLWKNDGGHRLPYLSVQLKAKQIKEEGPTASGRINHGGLGSRVELFAGDHTLRAMMQGPDVHFGLGKLPAPTAVRVVWPNGMPRQVLNPVANTTVFEEQVLTGSCPYLYTWNGERFVFVTDLLWNAPLGLKFAEDVVAPWREWEYLKVDGELLKPDAQGLYTLQITEELWEAAYYDEVRLMAIDHPAGTEVYTNEKVGPAALASHQLHFVSQRQPLTAIRTGDGRDLGATLARRDGQFAAAFGEKLRQGLTTPQTMDFDFGDLSAAKTVTLLMTGWLRPGDTSISVGVSQDATLTPSTPPSFWRKNAAGEWSEVVPFAGFPGGKTKTVVYDVSFLAGDPQAMLQLRTNMEFYWDEAFFTVDEASPDHREQDCTLASADLHYRGFSHWRHDSGLGPDHYQYDAVEQNSPWLAMSGHLTRYGDVRELLTVRDDRMAVFGAGDEMTLRFTPPATPLPEGWVRDFVLYEVGWDKDCNLNTVYGESVEPLPFAGMTEYGFANGETRARDDEYEAYLKQYQTRRQSARRFWTAPRP